MTINGFRNRLREAAFYIPFTLYFFLFVVAASAAWKYLNNKPYDSFSAFADIFALLLKVAFFFGLILLATALVSVLISVFYFLYKRRKNSIDFKLSTDLKESELNQKQIVRLFISPLLKPIFGFVKIRLQYDETHFSDKFQLLEKAQHQMLNNKIEGTYHWPLPQIKEYHVQKAILYFEDFLQFFSIAVDLPASNHFFTQPTALQKPGLAVKPRKTEETNTRIEELRKVEGEYLNYKNFENNDDVRRIVWKIYAKNKELVVRIPETLDPYASHVYLYASFYSVFNVLGSSPVEVPFLNYYKEMLWTLYQNLVKQGFEVRYVPDQETARKNLSDKQQLVKYSISTSHWQTNKDLNTYCKTSDASVLVISSLSDAGQVQELAERHGNDINFIFVKLTDSLNRQNMFDWVQWLFVQNEKNDMERYKTAWSVSVGLRSKIAENEKKLQQILKKYQAEGVAEW